MARPKRARYRRDTELLRVWQMVASRRWLTLLARRIPTMVGWLTTAAAGPASLPAQAPPPRTPAPVEFAVEQRTRDRWLHGRQQPRFTRFAESRSWLLGDSVRAGASGGRRLYLTPGRFAEGRDSAYIETDRDGRVVRLAASLRPPSRAMALLPGDSARFARFRLFDGGHLTLPETRLWDLTPSFRPATVRPGMRWSDTLERVATRDGYRQSLRGVRVSTLIGDTTVGERRLWIVRDSARVRYEERWLEEERTLGTDVAVTRTANGIIRGRYLYDPERRLFRARSDTTSLAGEALLQYPNSYPGVRTFRTPARYERYRDWDVYDQAGYTARQTALRTAANRDRGGMVVAPSTSVERRLAEGDTVVRDSVIAEWWRSEDPDHRERLFRMLQMWGTQRDRMFYLRLDSLRVASGDTAYLQSWLAQRAYSPGRPTTVPEMQSMLRFMENPGLAFAFNQSRDWLYENLRQALTQSPPAVVPERAAPCVPAACRLLADQWRSAREPRLRELGLVALVTLEPARWSDTVLARATAGSRFLEPAAMLVRGVGATWPAAAKAEIPSPNASWHAWADWMTAPNAAYAAARAAANASLGLPAPRPEPRVRFEESHAAAIRFFQARTGRDMIAELRRGLETADSDSARLVFGTMLQGLGELRLSADEMVAHFRSGEPGRVALAQRSLIEMFWRDNRARPADSITTLAILDRLASQVLEGGAPWRTLDGRPAAGRQGPELHAAPAQKSIFLLADSLPAALRDKWKDRVRVVTSAEWRDRPLTDAGVLYTLSGVRQAGPFISVTVGSQEHMARRPGEAPQLFAAGTAYYLMELNGEWVIVSTDWWVT